MSSISKIGYIEKLDDLVNKCNGTHHRTIKMEPVDLKLSMYIDFDKENDKESPKPKVGDHARIPKYNNLFSKDYVPVWSEEVFLIKKVMNTVLWTYVISDPKGRKLLEHLKKVINYMLHGKITIILLTVGLIKKAV